jgi:hypothetical protein
MPAEILRFEYNVPVQLSLKYRDGRSTDGKYGPQVMYSLSDGRVMYLDPPVAESLKELGVQPGEPFCICKSKDGRQVNWSVWLAPQTEKKRAAAEGPSDLEVKLQQSLDRVHQVPRKQVQSQPAPAVSETRSTGTYGPHPIPVPVSLPTKQQYGDAMAEFLVMAGRAARRAETILGKEEGSVRFNSRDIAAFATTCFIAAENRGLLLWTPGGKPK